MGFDREAALRSAEKALKIGRLETAIAEFVRIVDDQPRDFASVNTLGDLYARAGLPDSAIAQYRVAAGHLAADGFLPKAIALLKKILKLQPHDEAALLELGRLTAAQGLLADARVCFHAVERRRRERGDERGADAAVSAMADADPADADVQLRAARLEAGRGRQADAAARLGGLADLLVDQDRTLDAADALREGIHLAPDDVAIRRKLIALLLKSGAGHEAEVYLTRASAGDDAMLVWMLARAELESGRLEEGRADLARALTLGADLTPILAFLKGAAPRRPELAALVADDVADAALAAGDASGAVTVLSSLLAASPGQVSAAMRLVEICLDADDAEALRRAQASLADAHLAAGHPERARIIAEDLVAAAPDDVDARARLERVHQSLGSGSRDPDRISVEHGLDEGVDVADAELVERLLAEEAARDGVQEAGLRPEVDLTGSLESLDEALAAATSELAASLADTNAAEEAASSLEDVFHQIRVEDRDEHRHQADTALEEASLAEAMGQVGDAERLFAEAARSRTHRFPAAAGLGRLLLREQRLEEAIEWLERAAEAPAPDVEAGFALRYDLGDALERHGETVRALALFMELQAEAGDYRGISARVERLARAGIGG